MAHCPICGAPVAAQENQVCENCRQSSYTAYTDAQGRPVFATDVPQQTQVQRLPGTPITKMLLAANIAVFLLMVVNGVSAIAPTGEQLFHWGGDFGPAVLLEGEYWRMFTAIFLHAGIVHLAVNMWSLWQLGGLCERLMGRNAYLALYILSGLAGNILSIAVNPSVLGVGASGAIFGIAGALVAILKFVRLNAPPERVKSMWNNLVVVIGVNLFIGWNSVRIDNMAHVGGLVCGLVIAFFLSKNMNHSPDEYRRVQSKVFPLATLSLAILFMAARYWGLAKLAQHPLQ